MNSELNESYDAVVIGGGAAGLNGALMLARSRRAVAVIDAGEPRNAPATGIHGMLGHDGVPPSELLAKGRDELRSYGGQVIEGNVVGAARHEDGFLVTLADGRRTTARRLLVTTGVVDELPDVQGLRDHWGHGVVHCPYCHGWEVRDQRIVVLGTTEFGAIHQSLLFSQLSDEVTLLTNGLDLPAEELAKLARVGVKVVDGRAEAIEGDDELTGIRLADGSTVDAQAVAVASRPQARAGFLDALGLEAVEHPSGMADHVPADATGRSDVPGVWLAGNVSDPMAQVGASAAAGAMAGAQINADLVMEDASA